MDLIKFLGLSGREDVQAAIDKASRHLKEELLCCGALDMEQAPWLPKLRQAILDKGGKWRAMLMGSSTGRELKAGTAARHGGVRRLKRWCRIEPNLP